MIEFFDELASEAGNILFGESSNFFDGFENRIPFFRLFYALDTETSAASFGTGNDLDPTTGTISQSDSSFLNSSRIQSYLDPIPQKVKAELEDFIKRVDVGNKIKKVVDITPLVQPYVDTISVSKKLASGVGVSEASMTLSYSASEVLRTMNGGDPTKLPPYPFLKPSTSVSQFIILVAGYYNLPDDKSGLRTFKENVITINKSAVETGYDVAPDNTVTDTPPRRIPYVGQKKIISGRPGTRGLASIRYLSGIVTYGKLNPPQVSGGEDGIITMTYTIAPMQPKDFMNSTNASQVNMLLYNKDVRKLISKVNVSDAGALVSKDAEADLAGTANMLPPTVVFKKEKQTLFALIQGACINCTLLKDKVNIMYENNLDVSGIYQSAGKGKSGTNAASYRADAQNTRLGGGEENAYVIFQQPAPSDVDIYIQASFASADSLIDPSVWLSFYRSANPGEVELEYLRSLFKSHGVEVIEDTANRRIRFARPVPTNLPTSSGSSTPSGTGLPSSSGVTVDKGGVTNYNFDKIRENPLETSDPPSDAPVGLLLEYGKEVVAFSYSTEPVTSNNGNTMSVLKEIDGEFFEFAINEAALQAKVDEAEARGGEYGTLMKEMWEYAQNDPDRFIVEFTKLTGNLPQNVVQKAPAGGSGSIKLDLNLKYAIPGLRPKFTVGFQSPIAGLIPPFIEGVYEVMEVVEEFTSDDELWTQTLKCWRK